VGTGLWVALLFPLTAWHVVSSDGRHSSQPDALEKPSDKIAVFLSGKALSLRHGETCHVRVATAAHTGLPQRVDLALIYVPVGDDAPALKVTPCALSIHLHAAAVDALAGRNDAAFEYHGFPGGAPRSPSQRRPLALQAGSEHAPRRADALRGGSLSTSGRVKRRPAVRPHGQCPALGRYHVARRARPLTHSGFVLPGAIAKFLETARAAQFHDFAPPPFADLRVALLDEAR
jgi:hypothetical protein